MANEKYRTRVGINVIEKVISLKERKYSLKGRILCA